MRWQKLWLRLKKFWAGSRRHYNNSADISIWLIWLQTFPLKSFPLKILNQEILFVAPLLSILYLVRIIYLLSCLYYTVWRYSSQFLVHCITGVSISSVIVRAATQVTSCWKLKPIQSKKIRRQQLSLILCEDQSSKDYHSQDISTTQNIRRHALYSVWQYTTCFFQIWHLSQTCWQHLSTLSFQENLNERWQFWAAKLKWEESKNKILEKLPS